MKICGTLYRLHSGCLFAFNGGVDWNVLIETKFVTVVADFMVKASFICVAASFFQYCPNHCIEKSFANPYFVNWKIGI